MTDQSHTRYTCGPNHGLDKSMQLALMTFHRVSVKTIQKWITESDGEMSMSAWLKYKKARGTSSLLNGIAQWSYSFYPKQLLWLTLGKVWTQPGLSCIVLTWGILEKGRQMGVATHQLWSRISAAFCVQPVYTTGSTCIHRHMVGTHAPAAYSNVAANTTAVPCTVSVHVPTVLPGCLL